MTRDTTFRDNSDLLSEILQVEYIWNLNLSLGKLLFVLNRYAPFGLVPLMIHGYFFATSTRVSPQMTPVTHG